MCVMRAHIYIYICRRHTTWWVKTYNMRRPCFFTARVPADMHGSSVRARHAVHPSCDLTQPSQLHPIHHLMLRTPTALLHTPQSTHALADLLPLCSQLSIAVAVAVVLCLCSRDQTVPPQQPSFLFGLVIRFGPKASLGWKKRADSLNVPGSGRLLKSSVVVWQTRTEAPQNLATGPSTPLGNSVITDPLSN